MDPHTTFVVSAYAISAVVVLAMIGWIVFDHRRLNRAIDELEARGITRRSAQRNAP